MESAKRIRESAVRSVYGIERCVFLVPKMRDAFTTICSAWIFRV